MTNVFLSWSGDLSKSIAEELHIWIPSVLQFAKPYFTPNDVEKGAKWSSEISKKLSESHVGIICLTRENTTRPWILFEAGALSKNLEQARICSVLFGIENSDLSGPLVTFQTTVFEKSDFRKLLSTINDAGGENKLSRETFESVFEMWWPQLETKIQQILSGKELLSGDEIRSEREILEEILSLNRLASRRAVNSTGEFSPMYLSRISAIADNLLIEAQNFSDRDILNAALELLTLCEMINDKHVRSLRLRETISSIRERAEEMREHLIKHSDSNDDIPF